MSTKPGWKRQLPALLIGLGTVSLGMGTIYIVRGFLSTTPAPQKKVVQEVRIIRPPPPPPEERPPPPPPPPEEKVDIPQPRPDPVASNEPPPGADLGVDQAGSGAGDGFGLVGRPGGRDLLASGGSAFSWYAGLIKDELQSRLTGDKRIRNGSYSVIVRVWVRNDGVVEKANIQGSSGDAERDRVIQNILTELTRLTQAPPADMPQPISLRIVSRV